PFQLLEMHLNVWSPLNSQRSTPPWFSTLSSSSSSSSLVMRSLATSLGKSRHHPMNISSVNFTLLLPLGTALEHPHTKNTAITKNIALQNPIGIWTPPVSF